MKLSCVEYDDDSFSIYISIDDVSIGTVSVNFNYIASLYIVESSRRKGYGSTLLGLAEKWIIKKEYSSITLHAIQRDPYVVQDSLYQFYTVNGYVTSDYQQFTKTV